MHRLGYYSYNGALGTQVAVSKTWWFLKTEVPSATLEIIHIYIYVCICMYIHIYIYIHICIHIHICAYVHICIYTEILILAHVRFRRIKMGRPQRSTLYVCVYVYICNIYILSYMGIIMLMEVLLEDSVSMVLRISHLSHTQYFPT